MPYPTKKQLIRFFKQWKHLFLVMGFQLLALAVTVPKSRIHFLIMVTGFLFVNVVFVFFNINWYRKPKNGSKKKRIDHSEVL